MQHCLFIDPPVEWGETPPRQLTPAMLPLLTTKPWKTAGKEAKAKHTSKNYSIGKKNTHTEGERETQERHEHKGWGKGQGGDRASLWRTKIWIQDIWNDALTARGERGSRVPDGPAQRAWVKRKDREREKKERRTAWGNKQTVVVSRRGFQNAS